MDISKIRNFCIIAHIDHGKSTLADRFLEFASGKKLKMGQERVLDTLDIEQERGITIKMQSARLNWDGYILNLIDTPGHVDFSFEVSRSVVASEGALLLVDAKQGIQAQTITNAKLAQKYGLEIIPVISKIDIEGVDIERRKKEMQAMLGFKLGDIFLASGKTGQGAKELLDAITTFVPSPEARSTKELQALVFDSFYDEHKGIILLLRVFGGSITKGQKLFVSGRPFVAGEVGYITPAFIPQQVLGAGEVGYVETGVKDVHYISVGETVTESPDTKPIYSYQKPVPRIFASVFPIESSEYVQLEKSIDKLTLSDPSLSIVPQRSEFLGTGFRIGFLGLLHMDVFQERLEREFNSALIVTSPSVKYKAYTNTGEVFNIETPSDFPDPANIKYFEEPFVDMEILTPVEYMSAIMDLCQNCRAEYIETQMGENLYELDFIELTYKMPLAEVVSGFFDKLKSVSRGFASMDYSGEFYRKVQLSKVSILVKQNEVHALSFISVSDRARTKAVSLLSILKDTIPRHQFEIPLQAAIGGTIIARETVQAFRKDVLHKLHASDPGRRMKLLENQKKGKARMKEVGNVNIPQEAFLAVLKS
ncbi:elongation factor 4 [Candidatus Dojkabacteria bacterium]|nr:elongation factor 4 [Candidatus Dojkabacteria bacterium]